MFLQQRQELLLETDFAMMCVLVLDILNQLVQLRHAHAEGAVLFLPAKQTVFREALRHPFRGAALDELERLGNRHRRRQGKQDMHVVLDASDFQRPHFVLTRNAAQEGPEPLAQRGRNQRAAFFGADNAVEIGADVGHPTIQSSFWDRCNWKVVCPKGTIANSPAFQRRVTSVGMTSPEGTADGRSRPNSSAVPSGLGSCGLLPGAKAPGYSRGVPPGQRSVKRPQHSHATASLLMCNTAQEWLGPLVQSWLQVFCPEGTIDNSPAFQRRVTRAGMTSPEGTADDPSHPNSSAVPSGLGPCGLLPGAKAPGYSRCVPPGQRGIKRPRHSHAAASLLARNAAQEWPEPLPQGRRNRRASFFGAEDTVEIGADVGHPTIQSSFRDPFNAKVFCPEGTIANSPAFQRRVTSVGMTSPEGTADGRSRPNSSAVPSGLGSCGLLPGAKAPGYSRGVPSGQPDGKRLGHSHDVAS